MSRLINNGQINRLLNYPILWVRIACAWGIEKSDNEAIIEPKYLIKYAEMDKKLTRSYRTVIKYPLESLFNQNLNSIIPIEAFWH